MAPLPACWCMPLWLCAAIPLASRCCCCVTTAATFSIHFGKLLPDCPESLVPSGALLDPSRQGALWERWAAMLQSTPPAGILIPLFGTPLIH